MSDEKRENLTKHRDLLVSRRAVPQEISKQTPANQAVKTHLTSFFAVPSTGWFGFVHLYTCQPQSTKEDEKETQARFKQVGNRSGLA